MSVAAEEWFEFKRKRKEQRANEAKLHFGEATRLKKDIVSSHASAKAADLQRRRAEHAAMLEQHKLAKGTD